MKLTVKPLLAEWEWQSRAACRGMSPAVFFSPHLEGGRARRQREAAARTVCGSCPVADTCARFAVATQQKYGVWGGLTESDRRPVTTL